MSIQLRCKLGLLHYAMLYISLFWIIWYISAFHHNPRILPILLDLTLNFPIIILNIKIFVCTWNDGKSIQKKFIKFTVPRLYKNNSLITTKCSKIYRFHKRGLNFGCMLFLLFQNTRLWMIKAIPQFFLAIRQRCNLNT